MYIRKTYLALVQGALPKGRRGTIRASVQVDSYYRPAVTRFKVLESNSGVALVELRPLTGRKHQLRVHCASYLKAPIIGDYRYGFRDERFQSSMRGQDEELEDDEFQYQLQRRMRQGRNRRPSSSSYRAGAQHAPSVAAPIYLHSWKVVVRKPRKKPFDFSAPLPQHMRSLVKALAWQITT